MKRALPAACLGLLICILASGCTLTRSPQANPMPPQARADSGRYIVVTVRNDARASWSAVA